MRGCRDTIFAPATARGRAAVCVIRVSGPQADAALEALVGNLPEFRRASVRLVRRPTDREPLDECLVLRFAEEASFTGEAAFELQGHGGAATVAALLDALADLPGLRLAEPGEFTRRAFEAGRLDLPSAEALADLALAETEAQRRLALRGLRGGLTVEVQSWRSRLIRARALIEATLDFADEEVPIDVGPEVTELLTSVHADMTKALAGADAAERVREGFEVAIIGAPNAGKSSLLNALAGRDAALTSSVAGTTRDVIEVRMDLGGLPVTLLDTAGLRESDDPVEIMGIDRARVRAQAADLRVALRAPGDPVMDDLVQSDDLVVWSKSDLAQMPGFSVSTVTGHGVAALLDLVVNALSQRAQGAGVVARARHRQAVVKGIVHVDEALASLAQGCEELGAESVRSACVALESLLGRVDVEEVLDDIFGTFCLGK